ncbi:MAG TPA: protein kinase [Sandaracinaceae bacterium LLY-WYZ-13_1]|nr:protein kinase [Sandaracinaceae bacterium LLY-WYZ-13_1]
MDLTGQTLLGKYEIERLLGVGGMGAVWRARHALTGRKLAIKVLDEGYLGNEQVVKRFGREARVASTVQHPGIVEVLDLDQTEEGVPFLVMEFLEGETLAARIERRGRLEQEELVRLAKMLLEALDAAHTHGVIHRDLKPENIYVVPAGRRGEVVKILDFGISHMNEEGQNKLTMTGSVLGTPHYMSPEQAMGETEVDHRADLYAAGVVLYECAVGDVPFDAPNYNKLLRLILDETPPTPRERGAEISAEVEKVILWAMDKERDRRIGSAREMLDWLTRAVAGEAVPYEPRGSSLPAPSGAGLTPPPTDTPRPAGALPALRSSLATTPGERWAPSEPPAPSSVEVDLGLETPDEEADWEVSPTLAQRAESGALHSSTPPPSGSAELDLGFDDPLAPQPTGDLDLELDEGALRPRTSYPPARTSTPPARSEPPTGIASSSGRFAAVGVDPASSTPPPSSPGALASPTAASSGMHSVPPRVSQVSGRYDAVPAATEAPEKPAWRRYLLFGAVGLAVFVGVVALVRWVVQPGVDDEAIHGDATAAPPEERPDEPEETTPRGPRWVSVRVAGLPPSARMRLDGLPVTSPFRVRAGGSHVLEISAEGYEDRRIEFEADRNRTLRAGLRPAVGVGREAP